MSLVASTIPNLVSGVSQQPAPSRLRTSGELIDNAFPSIVSGLMKRPPSQYVSQLSPAITVSDTSGVHMIDRAVDEKYILICGSGDLELYDTVGVKQTVTYPDGKAYLPTTDMWRKLRFVTVADTTFILNREKVVAGANIAETRTNPAIRGSVFIKKSVAAVTYAIYVQGVLKASFTTSDNLTAGTALEGTTEIAQALAAALVVSGYTDAEAFGSTVTFGITSGDVITVLDEFGGASMTPYTTTVQAFEALPPYEQEGRLVKIKGNIESASSAYWVQYSQGIWSETVGYNEQRTLDASTMPHLLVKTAPNTFEFRKNTWTSRPTGDSVTNPDPTFVGNTINGIFFFKGRLGLLSEENVVLSKVANFEDFYLETVLQNLDTDPIDVASATGRVSTLYHAASFANELVLFSDKQQFRLSSSSVLSASSVGITNSTSYPSSIYVAPVAVGSSAFFVADGVTNSIARELFIDADRETVEGEDITVQVPSYIPTNVRALAASTSADVFLALSEDEPSSLYVYKWYKAGQQKIQSAWCKWNFNPNSVIVGMGFLDRYLYLVYKVGTDVRIDKLNVAPIIDVDLLLDHQITQASFTSVVYDGVADATTIVLPYDHPATIEFYRTDADAFAPYEGVTKTNDTTYVVPGDVTGHSIVAGLNYEFRYRFSKQYLKEQNSDGESAIQDGRLQLRYFSVIYTDSSYFEAHVTPTNGATYVSVFNGRTLADPDNVTDLIPRDTGEFKFPVFAQNEEVVIDLVNDQPYRCAFGSVEWTANYRQKARRV